MLGMQVSAGGCRGEQVSAGQCRHSPAGCWAGGCRKSRAVCALSEALRASMPAAVWAATPVVLALPSLPALPAVCCYLYIHYNHLLFPVSSVWSQPPPLAGPNPVGCNPRGAPDTVNSPFTRAAELLQTFLLIFTGLKASPFSLIIP